MIVANLHMDPHPVSELFRVFQTRFGRELITVSHRVSKLFV
jgi:hypothetical protein